MEAREVTIEQIAELQKQYGLSELQEKINTGDAWLLEGSYGRAAMSALEDGACMLPEESHTDYYGNHVPSRSEVKMGTNGSLENSQEFWAKVLNGEIDLPEPQKTYVVYDIKYDTDGEDVDLPQRLEIELPQSITDPDEIAEELSDEISNRTGFCHKGFKIEGEE